MGGAYLWLSEVIWKWEEHIYCWSELVSVKGGTYLQLCEVLRKGAEPIYNWSDA